MRIRSIKPEFWNSEDVAQLSYFDRLLFIGLWSYVQDNGVGRDNIRLIAASLFPLDEDTAGVNERVDKGLSAVADAGLILRYVVAGRPYFYVLKWSKHQRINRPTRSTYPLPPHDVISELSGDLHEDSQQLHEDSGNSHEGSLPGSRDARVLSEDSLPGSRDQGIKGTREQGIKGYLHQSVNQLQVVGRQGNNLTIDGPDLERIIQLTGGGDEAHLVAVCNHYLSRAKTDVAKAGAFVIRSIGNDPDPTNYRYQRPSPTKAQECPSHPGQWPDTCKGCAADKLFGD